MHPSTLPCPPIVGTKPRHRHPDPYAELVSDDINRNSSGSLSGPCVLCRQSRHRLRGGDIPPYRPFSRAALGAYGAECRILPSFLHFRRFENGGKMSDSLRPKTAIGSLEGPWLSFSRSPLQYLALNSRNPPILTDFSKQEI
jgi:hypothetical protein